MTASFLVAALLTAFQAQTSPPVPAASAGTDVSALITKVRALIDDGRAKDAIQALQAAGPSEDVRLAELLGVAYYHADDYQNAVKTLEPVRGRLSEGTLERAEAEQVLGLSLHLLGRYGEAIPWLEQTYTRMRHDLKLAQILGLAYIQTGQAAKARAVLAPVFDVAAESAANHLATAQLMVRLEQNELAETELKLAIGKDARLPRAHWLLGQLALFRGRLDDAIDLTKRELAINPTDAMAFAQLGDAYVRQQRWDEAITALQRSIWINPYYSAPYILLGRAYLQKQQPATAEGVLRRAVEYDPNNRTAHYLLGQVLQRMGRTEEARREFETAEKLQATGRR